eukprot:1139843-Pelagomonas_calceolata.AAC.2
MLAVSEVSHGHPDAAHEPRHAHVLCLYVLHSLGVCSDSCAEVLTPLDVDVDVDADGLPAPSLKEA